jgi:hypothetical protein
MTTEFRDGKKVFALSAPRGAFRAYFTSARPAALTTMIFITSEVREGDVFQRPEKLNAHPLPRFFVLNAQFLGSLYYFRTLET